MDSREYFEWLYMVSFQSVQACTFCMSDISPLLILRMTRCLRGTGCIYYPHSIHMVYCRNIRELNKPTTKTLISRVLRTFQLRSQVDIWCSSDKWNGPRWKSSQRHIHTLRQKLGYSVFGIWRMGEAKIRHINKAPCYFQQLKTNCVWLRNKDC